MESSSLLSLGSDRYGSGLCLEFVAREVQPQNGMFGSQRRRDLSLWKYLGLGSLSK